MKKALLLSIVVSCGLILGTGYIFSYMNSKVDNNIYGFEKESMVDTEKFSNIYVSVNTANINIIKGDRYSVSYKLSDKEYVRRLEIIKDNLYFETDRNNKFGHKTSGYNVTIMIPKDKELNELNLYTIDGNITNNETIFNKGEFETVFGKITLNGSYSNEIEASTTSGGLNIEKGNISKLEFDNKTGKIYINGIFDDIDISSISGSCKFDGKVNNKAEMETISGKIDVKSGNSSFEAESYGGVYWNGVRKGYSFSKFENGPHLNLESISGKIKIIE